jgi:hypothetical protein
VFRAAHKAGKENFLQTPLPAFSANAFFQLLFVTILHSTIKKSHRAGKL